jgi:hypothetical protein
MSTYTLPPPDLSSPISKRAVQILRELQGLRLLDKEIPTLSEEIKQPFSKGNAKDSSARVEPVLNQKIPLASAATQEISAAVHPWRKVAFSRENYLKDVRSSLMGSMALAILMLCIVFGLMTTATVSYLLPSLEDLEQQSEKIKSLPNDLKSATDQIQMQEKRRQELMLEQEKLVSFFPNSHQAYTSYGSFLTLLEGHKVAVTSQRGGITQSLANPMMADAAANAEIRKKTEQALAANPKATPPAAPKLSMLSGDIKPGLNYYHLGFTLEGSYVGYLAARQALVNENPNLVVHSESVLSMKDRPSVLEITTYVSIPFIQKP